VDIPRIFNITESAHRIHNPFTPEKLATLGAALRLEPGTRVLDLGSGSGEMLCTWARDYGISGAGIDMSQLFTEQAKLRADELGVADRVEFIHGVLPSYVSDEKGRWQPASVPPGSAGVAGTIELLAQRPAPEDHPHRRATGGSRRRRGAMVAPLDLRLPRASQNYSVFRPARYDVVRNGYQPDLGQMTETGGQMAHHAPMAKPIPTTNSRKMFEPN
jgi:SAM-dependent methyltransferase